MKLKPKIKWSFVCTFEVISLPIIFIGHIIISIKNLTYTKIKITLSVGLMTLQMQFLAQYK